MEGGLGPRDAPGLEPRHGCRRSRGGDRPLSGAARRRVAIRPRSRGGGRPRSRHGRRQELPRRRDDPVPALPAAPRRGKRPLPPRGPRARAVRPRGRGAARGLRPPLSGRARCGPAPRRPGEEPRSQAPADGAAHPHRDPRPDRDGGADRRDSHRESTVLRADGPPRVRARRARLPPAASAARPRGDGRRGPARRGLAPRATEAASSQGFGPDDPRGGHFDADAGRDGGAGRLVDAHPSRPADGERPRGAGEGALQRTRPRRRGSSRPCRRACARRRPCARASGRRPRTR